MTTSTHTNKEFDQELRTLRDRLCAMGGRCEQQMERAMEALADRDVAAAKKVIDGDHEIGVPVGAMARCRSNPYSPLYSPS